MDVRNELKALTFGFYQEDPSWHHRYSAEPTHTFMFVVDGGIEAVIGKDKLSVRRGSMIWIQPGVRFAMHFDKNRKSLRRYVLAFSLQSKKSKQPFVYGDPYLLVEEAWDMENQVKGLLDEQRSEKPWKEIRLRLMLGEMLLNLLRRSQANSREDSLSAVQRLMIVRFMEGNLNWRPTPGELAIEVGLSQDYFSRLFRKTFGKSPKVWITQERLRHASLKLLDTNLPIGDVAGLFGYESTFLFSRQFKNFFKMSPREFRLRKRY